MIRAVLFDLFETLIIEVEAGKPYVVPKWGSPAGVLGLTADEFRRGWEDLRSRRMTSALSYLQSLHEVCASAGREPPMEAIEALNYSRRRDKARCFESIEPDVLWMLRNLRADGTILGVVSNCSVEEIEAFRGSLLAPLFDDIVWSFEVGIAKPDRRIFEASCRRLAVSAEDAIFVGDGSFDELAGARTAGLTAVWATWFVNRWPARLSEPRRSLLQSAGFVEARTPNDLAGFVRHAGDRPPASCQRRGEPQR